MTYIEMCKYIFKEEGFSDFKSVQKSKSREGTIKTARQICMYLGTVYFNGITLTLLAEPFGKKHTTAIHSIKTINNLRETESKFDEKIKNYIFNLDQLFHESIIMARITKERELANMLLDKIEDMKLIAKVYCVLANKKISDL